MALAIRLSRGGAKRRPYYRIVVADTRSPRDGRFIEKIGSYNPLLPKDREDRIQIQEDRVKHWLDLGARPTDRVSRFLEARGLLEAKARSNPNKGKPGTKSAEREEARKEKAAAASEAPAAEEAEAEAEAAEPAES